MLREMDILRRIRHSNIVALYEVAVDRELGDSYMVMEVMDCDLRELMRDMQRPFQCAEVRAPSAAPTTSIYHEI